MIVDSVVSVVTGDSHKNAEVRRALQSVVDFGERRSCAILDITHFTKGTQGREPWERVTGSLAFAAVARLVLSTAKMGEEGGHVLVRAKSNIGPDSGDFRYELQQQRLHASGILVSRVEWGASVNGSAREILERAEQPRERERGGDKPTDFLRSLLSGGPMAASDVFAAANANGHSKAQMHRARKAIGARVDKLGMKAAGSGVFRRHRPKMSKVSKTTV